MASVVIILSSIAVYKYVKTRKEKKALRLEEEKETALANEQIRVMQQLEDDRSSVYSGHTLTNEVRDTKGMARIETTETSASSTSRSGKLKRKMKALAGRGVRMNSGDDRRPAGHFP